MLLNNGGAVIGNILSQSDSQRPKTYIGWDISNGTSFTAASNLSYALTALNTSRAWGDYSMTADSGCHILLGKGTTTPTASDYKIEDFVDPSTDLLYVSGSVLYPSTATTIYGLTQVFQNVSGSAIQVSEIGLCIKVGYDWQSSHAYLLTHSVLSSPVTLQPGRTYSFTTTIDLNV